MIRIRLLPQLLTFNGFMLLLIGGIVYTIGAVLYIVGKSINGDILYFILLVSLQAYYTFSVYFSM